MESFNPYHKKFKEDCPENLFKFIYNYLVSNSSKVVPNCNNYSIDATFDELSLLIKVNISSFNSDYLIVEFMKIDGDKENFLEIFMKFQKSK